MKYTIIMSEKSIDKLEKFTRKMVSELPQEQPSSTFQVNVMDAINALESKTASVAYEPLISKKVWYFLAAAIVVLTVLLWNSTSGESSLLSAIDLSKYTNAVSFDMSLGFSVSNITIYGFIFLAIMVTIQIGYIKNYYNNRYSN